MTAQDEGLIEWAQRPHRLHVLLSKADKLNRSEQATALRTATARLGGRGRAQLFSALRGVGVHEAQETIATWLGLGPRH